MNRIHNTTKNTNSKGFTLVELMVVVAIIAVLAVVGLTVFANSQQGARNAKRQSDLKAISSGMETHYSVTAGQYCAAGTVGSSYCPLQSNWFASQLLPTDPAGGFYCINSSLTRGTVIVDMAPTGTAGACNGAYGAISTATPVVNTTDWKICATLEPFSASSKVYCVTNQQE